MTRKLLCLAMALVLVLSGCIYKNSVDYGKELVVYRLEVSENGRRLVAEKPAFGGEGDPLSLVSSALMDDTGAVASRSALTGGLSIENVRFEKGVANVELSPQYKVMEKFDRILAESAIVLSLCALDKVCYVNLYCEGEMQGSLLTAEDYSVYDSLCGGGERIMKLYLPTGSGRALEPRSVTVSDDGSTSAAYMVMGELIKQLEGTENAEIVSITLAEGLCSVDLSHEFYGAEPAESHTGMLMIYSIVNSLCRVPGVERVSLSVEGYSVDSFGGYRIEWPLSENLALISY